MRTTNDVFFGPATSTRADSEGVARVDHEDRVHNPCDEQRAAIAAFCDSNGRDWKEKLAAVWTSGNYSRYGIGVDQAALLQQVRNQFGPEWLVNVSRAALDGPRRDVVQDADLDM